jgi:hypothetical protein
METSSDNGIDKTRLRVIVAGGGIGGEAALLDLKRRVGWLRQVADRCATEMHGDLSEFDADMERLRALTKRAGILKPTSWGA